MKAKFSSKLVLTTIAVCTASPVFAQDAPVPGGGVSAPVPGAYAQQAVRRAGGGAGYGDLPLNADDAKARITELTSAVSTSNPQQLQERVDQLSTWLTDMIDAHNKMSNGFAKHPETKAQSNAERQTAIRFIHLKNQCQLLKADLLIGMRRYPEALPPLVDIVIAEPTTETGKAAYKKLQDLGFSPETAEAPEAQAPTQMIVHEQTPAPATPAAPPAPKHPVAAKKAPASQAKKTTAFR